MKQATIQKIHSILRHPNPDVTKLEIGKVKEWPVVIPKGQFKDGDFVVFILIDSIVPETNPYFEFMRKQHFRVWNAKFKGAPSQGLVCPMSILPTLPKSWALDDDVSEVLGVTKYEKGLDATIAGDAKGRFPTDVVTITDEDNLLNYPEVLDEFRGELCYLTVKADGSSMTVIYDNGEVRVCSRRLEVKEGTGLWTLADSYALPDRLKELKKSLAIQAEACGGKIQGNPLGLKRPTMFVFNVKEHDTGRWYGWEEIKQTCSVLNIPTVQLVCEPFVFDDTWTIARLQELANKVTYTTDTGELRKGEGIVLRPVTPKFSPVIGKPLSVKILNQAY